MTNYKVKAGKQGLGDC